MSAPDVTLDEEIACVRREVKMRRSVYARWVAAGRMKASAAEREMRTMEAVLRRLEKVEAEGRLI